MNPSQPSPLVADLLQAFVRSLGGRDRKTLQAYRSTLQDLFTWLATKPGHQPFRVELLTETAVKSYLDHLGLLGRAPRTRRKALAAVRCFGRWAVAEGLLPHNPAAYLERPTVVQMAPTELTEEQRYVLKSLVEQTGSRRLRAIFALAYWTGLRVSEIALLRREDCEVNRRAGTITVRDSKGGKTRTLDLHNEARKALYAYLHDPIGDQDVRDPDSDYVFTSQRSAWLRCHGKPDHLSERALEYQWVSLKQKAAHDQWPLIQEVTVHDLRHDWAHRARQAGWQLEEIAVYAGHQTQDGAPAITTTARYTLPSRQQLKARLQALQG